LTLPARPPTPSCRPPDSASSASPPGAACRTPTPPPARSPRDC